MQLYKFKKIFFILILCFVNSSLASDATIKETKNFKVGLLIVATGKYIQFVKPLIKSAQKYFCQNHDVTYFVFTDEKTPNIENIIRIEQKRLGWPYDTMMRHEMYFIAKQQLEKMDYLFACDADMRFVDVVGDEILSDRVGTQHPGFIVDKTGTYENRKISKAYVACSKGKVYFCGGFHGGSTQEFLKLSKTIATNVRLDLEKNIIAVWHDESHLNRYFIDNQPTIILSPSYCYPENWKLPYHKRLLALDKNHEQLRK